MRRAQRTLVIVLAVAVGAFVGAFVGLGTMLWEVAIGSDELEPYTAKYAWLENQMSHAMMGFCLMGFFWAIWIRGQKPAAQAMAEPPTNRFWRLRFRVGNRILWPFLFLLFKDFILDNAKDVCATWNSPVQPYWLPVIFDAITDDVFWYFGFSLALFAIAFWSTNSGLTWWLWLISSIVFLAFGLLFGSYWVPQKDSFDRSGLPLNYTRLAILSKDLRFPEDARDKQRKRLRDIQTSAREGKPVHVIVYGGTPQMRNDLAVSIGCEYVFRLNVVGPRGWNGPRTVIYTSAARLLEDKRPVEALEAGQLRCLVISDLDTSLSPPPDVLIRVATTRNRPDIISGGIRNQLDLNNFFKYTPSPRTVYTRDTPLDSDDLRVLTDRYQPGKMLNQFVELLLVVMNRTKPFRTLVTQAKEKNVATIWTFAETPSWLGEFCKPEVEARHRQGDRDAWIFTLADLLGVPESEIYLIELSKP